MGKIEEFKERVLADYDRLGPDAEFTFSCHPGISCFNKCCGDVNIRLKRRLGISSTELIERHTLRPFSKEMTLPVLVLKMQDEKPGKPCPFVGEAGCTVYEDRPWPCRMYPVGEASAKTEMDPDAPEFFFLMQEEPCEGFSSGRRFTIREWMESQGTAPYQEVGALFKELCLHPKLKEGDLSPPQMEMFYTVCYDIDRFRAFVFESSFLEKYEVDGATLERIRGDDVELLKFGFDWLWTSLVHEPRIKLRGAVEEDYKRRIGRTGAEVKAGK
jgi:Fe-S-cluster containining protein